MDTIYRIQLFTLTVHILSTIWHPSSVYLLYISIPLIYQLSFHTSTAHYKLKRNSRTFSGLSVSFTSNVTDDGYLYLYHPFILSPLPSRVIRYLWFWFLVLAWPVYNHCSTYPYWQLSKQCSVKTYWKHAFVNYTKMVSTEFLSPFM